MVKSNLWHAVLVAAVPTPDPSEPGMLPDTGPEATPHTYLGLGLIAIGLVVLVLIRRMRSS